MSKMNWGKVNTQNRVQKYGLEIDYSVGADPNKMPLNFNPQRSTENSITIIIPGKAGPERKISTAHKLSKPKPKAPVIDCSIRGPEKRITLKPLHKMVACPICHKDVHADLLSQHITNKHSYKYNKTNTPKKLIRSVQNALRSKDKSAAPINALNLVKCSKCDAMLNEKKVQRHMNKVHTVKNAVSIEKKQGTFNKASLPSGPTSVNSAKCSSKSNNRKGSKTDKSKKGHIALIPLSKNKDGFERCAHCNLFILKSRISSHHQRVHSIDSTASRNPEN